MQRLKERTALITGGGRGIGKAVALKFAHEGAKTIIVDIDEKTGEETASEIRQKGQKADFIKAIIQYRKVISIDADNYQTYLGLGNIYQKKNRIEEAIEEYKKALSLKYDELKAHYNLARLYQKTEKFVKSYYHYKE